MSSQSNRESVEVVSHESLLGSSATLLWVKIDDEGVVFRVRDRGLLKLWLSSKEDMKIYENINTFIFYQWSHGGKPFPITIEFSKKEEKDVSTDNA